MLLTYVYLCFWMSEVFSSFRSLSSGAQVFALLMLFVCVILHAMSSGKIAMHLAIWYVVLVCHQYDVCENYVGRVYMGGYGELCPVSFLVVGECPSVLL